MDDKPKRSRSRIGRTVFETHCIGTRYDGDSHSMVDFNEVVEGRVSDCEKATRKLQKKFGTSRLVVTEIHHVKTYISAPIEKFMEIVDERTEMEID